MTGVLSTRIRRKFYLDSVALMRHSAVIADLDGVQDAAMMMATPANREIMYNAGLLDTATVEADAGDLIISVRGSASAVAEDAISEAIQLLDKPKSGGAATAWQPRSIQSAKNQLPGANLALISVAGDFAISEARKAIRSGMHVMIFSDNVPLKAEVELKREAAMLGRIVMGPDCGTAIIGGTPLAFANVVSRGDIGVIGASGTGIQEVTCLIDHGGQGISQAIGVGGRDLHADVGGVSTLMALQALIADPETRHIIIISKPPAQAVAERVLSAAGESDKSFTICFIGASPSDYSVPANATLTSTLKQAAESALGASLPGLTTDQLSLHPSLATGQNRIVGLFCGGTLCAEAQIIISRSGEIPASNTPVPGASNLKDSAGRHQLIDLGADEYTLGKPHPMIEPSVRDQALRSALQRDDVAVIVVDVVIGYGAHGDPAGQLVNMMKNIDKNTNGKQPTIVASVTGTESDPQVRSRQIKTLESAGIHVTQANADAIELALHFSGPVT